MKAQTLAGWRSIVTAFAIWFVHFMLCWTAAEIWPRAWQANALAWGFTAIALLAMAMHVRWLKARCALGDASSWNHRYARRAAGLATAAVVFSALPSMVFLP